MELHLVHIKKKYIHNVERALRKTDGLAVVGIMFIVGKNGSDFQPLQLDAFKGLNYPDDSPMVDNFRPPQPLNNRVVKRWMPMKK